MAETPSWLSPESTAAPIEQTSSPAAIATNPSGPKITVDEGAAAAAAGTGATASNNSVEDTTELPAIILTMRLANMGGAVALITVSVLLLIGFPSLSAFVLSIYAICGGVLICCLETQLKFLRVIIAVNFGFLFHPVWRFIFYLVLASITWSSYDSILGYAMAIALVVLAVMNTYILCRFPSYRKIREKIAEEEDKKIEARIAQQVRQQTINQLTRTG